MQLCSNEHGEVCYVETHCPACEAIKKQKEEHRLELKQYNKTIDRLEVELNKGE